jgi:hypothetical protein
MTEDDFKALLEQMEARLSGQMEDLNDANQELIRQLNEREEGPTPAEAPGLPTSSDDAPASIYPRWGVSQRAIDLFGWIPDEERRIEYMWRYSQIEFARASRHTVLWAGHVTMLLEGLTKDCLPALAVYFIDNEASHKNPILQRLFDNPSKQRDYEKSKSEKTRWQQEPYYLQQATQSNSISAIGDVPGKFVVMYKPNEEWCVFEKFQFDQQSSTLHINENSSQNSFQIQVSNTIATCIFNSEIEAILIQKDDLTRNSPIDVSEIFFLLDSPLKETKRWKKTNDKTGVIFINYSFRIGEQIANYGHPQHFTKNRIQLNETPLTLKIYEDKHGREFLSIKVPSKESFCKILTQFPGVKTAESIGIYLSAVQSLNERDLKATFETDALDRIITVRNDYSHMNYSRLTKSDEMFDFFDNHIHPLIEQNSRFFKTIRNINTEQTT